MLTSSPSRGPDKHRAEVTPELRYFLGEVFTAQRGVDFFRDPDIRMSHESGDCVDVHTRLDQHGPKRATKIVERDRAPDSGRRTVIPMEAT